MKKIFTVAVFLIFGFGPVVAQDTTRHMRYTPRDDRDPDAEYQSHSMHQGTVDIDTPSVRPIPGSEDKYCASVMNGKLVVMNNGKPITENRTLASGISISPDGTLIYKDGKKRMLKNGECIDKDTSAKR